MDGAGVSAALLAQDGCGLAGVRHIGDGDTTEQLTKMLGECTLATARRAFQQENLLVAVVVPVADATQRSALLR
jgi:hypothetical protein